MTQLGVLLIAGAQTHQENYARAFAADSRCRLVGLTDESTVTPQRRDLNLQLATDLGIPYLDDLDAALSRGDVDLVSVCAEPERRGRLVVAAADAGKHVYIDKPLAGSADEAREIIAAVERNQVRSQMFSLVRHPIAESARATLTSQRLGKLLGVHCELLFAKGQSGTADLSHIRRERSDVDRWTFTDSKRELFCVGLYPLVLFQWLTGERIVEVAATTGNYFFAEHQRNQVEDFSTMLLRTESGIEATITVGRSGWTSHAGSGIHQLQLIGTDDVATLDGFRPRLETHCDAPPWTPPTSPHPDDPMGFWSSTQQAGGVKPKRAWSPIAPVYQSDAAYFIDCLVNNRQSDVSAAIGAHALEIILAGYRAAASERFVSI